jgi:hypothetical protein
MRVSGEETVSEEEGGDESPLAAELLEELRTRIAELDTIAWNLPSRSSDLRVEPEEGRPAEEPAGLDPAA